MFPQHASAGEMQFPGGTSDAVGTVTDFIESPPVNAHLTPQANEGKGRASVCGESPRVSTGARLDLSCEDEKLGRRVS